MDFCAYKRGKWRGITPKKLPLPYPIIMVKDSPSIKTKRVADIESSPYSLPKLALDKLISVCYCYHRSLKLELKDMNKWKKLHKTISASNFDRSNKEADKKLVFFWQDFKRIKGKTFGNIIKKTESNLGIHPSFLALCCETAEEYIERKYGKR